ANQTPQMVKAELDKLLAQLIVEKAVTYQRTDGSMWKLTLSDLIKRRRALEVAYNPNDCVEKRWGAPSGSPERATCRRHVPEDQRAKMEEYRAWFRERKRPPRG